MMGPSVLFQLKDGVLEFPHNEVGYACVIFLISETLGTMAKGSYLLFLFKNTYLQWALVYMVVVNLIAGRVSSIEFGAFVSRAWALKHCA